MLHIKNFYNVKRCRFSNSQGADFSPICFCLYLLSHWPEVGLLNIQVRFKQHSKVWPKSYLWQLWIWSHLKLELRMSLCSTNWPLVWDRSVELKLMLSSSFRCDQIHNCNTYDVGSHLVMLLKSDLNIQQTHPRKQACWAPRSDLSKTTKCEQNDISGSCKFGHT
jgi:hypothetical protein